MRQRRTLLALTLCASLASTAAAQEGVTKSETLALYIEAGDARGVPLLRAELKAVEALPQVGYRAHERVVDAVEQATTFLLDEAGPAIVRAWASPKLSDAQRSRLIAAAARYRSPASERFQRTALADPRVVSDEDRVLLLCALAERGDDVAIDALLDWTRAEIVRRSRRLTSDGPPLATKWLICPVFTERLRASSPPEGLTRREWDLWWPRVVDVYLTAAELMARVEGATAQRDIQDALLMLAHAGTVDDLPRLSSLALGRDDRFADKEYFARLRDEAIAAIRRRYWQEAATRPALLPKGWPP
jgi:hypothetical protein